MEVYPLNVNQTLWKITRLLTILIGKSTTSMAIFNSTFFTLREGNHQPIQPKVRLHNQRKLSGREFDTKFSTADVDETAEGCHDQRHVDSAKTGLMLWLSPRHLPPSRLVSIPEKLSTAISVPNCCDRRLNGYFKPSPKYLSSWVNDPKSL